MQAPQLAPSLNNVLHAGCGAGQNGKLIGFGPRAGQPRPITDMIIDQLDALKKAALILKHNGYTVIGVVAGEGIPTLQVQACKRTTEAVTRNEAISYRQKVMADGSTLRFYQFGQKPHGVKVVFVEAA